MSDPPPTMFSRAFSAVSRVMPFLPPFPGPFAVGALDHEHIYARRSDPKPPSSVPLTETDAAKFTADIYPVDSLLFRLYYPCEAEGAAGMPWLPSPAAAYGGGYGRFMGLPASLSGVLFPLLTNWARSPVYPNARPKDGRWPVVVFSHGLGGNRSTYSHLCGTLASYGFIVAAIEHTDGSASYTCLDGGKYPVEYRRPPNKGLNAEELDILRAFRSSQVRYRGREIGRLLELLHQLNEGTYSSTFSQSLKSKLDLSQPIMAGHSFGAATALLSLSLFPFNAALILDAWMFSLPTDLSISKPILSFNSAAFHWHANLVRLHRLFPHLHPERADDLSDAEKASVFLTQPQTAHQNHSDLPILFPGLMRTIKMSGVADPLVAAEVQNRALLGFLRRRVDNPVAAALPEEFEEYLTGKGDLIVAQAGDAVLSKEEAEKLDKAEEKKEGAEGHVDRPDEEVDVDLQAENGNADVQGLENGEAKESASRL